MKTLNSNSLSAKFISIIGNSKAIILTLDNCKFAVAKTQFSILSFHFDHSPLPLHFFLECVLGRIFPEVRHFLATEDHPRRDRPTPGPTRLQLFVIVVSLPLEFGSHGKMRLTSLHDCYGSWHLYICCSLVRSQPFLFFAPVCEGHFMLCCAIQRNFK